MERIIIVKNNDGDIVGAVKPMDPQQPEITADLIEALDEVQTEIVIVNTWSEWDEYSKEQNS